MRCIHASHAALFFFFCPFVCFEVGVIYLHYIHAFVQLSTPALPSGGGQHQSSAPLLFPASWKGVGPQGKRAKKQIKPQHNRTKAQQNQEPCFALSEAQEAVPRQSVAAPAAHRRGMRAPRRTARRCRDALRRRAPPAAHWASALAYGGREEGRACVCVSRFSQKVAAEVQGCPRPVREGPVPGGGRPRPARRLSPTGSGSRSRTPCGPRRRCRARCASRTSRRPSARS